MRIDPQQAISSLDKKKGIDFMRDQTKTVSFQKMLHEKQELSAADRLSKLMTDIDAAGARLSKSNTIRDLAEYKKLVKSFMEEAVKNGIGMNDREGLSHRGRSKLYKMITEVDQKLLELTDEVLLQENKGINLLGNIGEIKGMLVNMLL